MSCMGHMRNMVVHLMKAAGRPAAFLLFIRQLFGNFVFKMGGISIKNENLEN